MVERSSESIFTAGELQGFDELGYVVVKQAFSKSVANDCVKHVWEAMQEREGVEPNDPSTWLKKVQMDRVWMANEGYPWSDVFTNRLHQAIREILLIDHDHQGTTDKEQQSVSDQPDDESNQQQSIGPFGAGWWTVLFPGFSEGFIRKSFLPNCYIPLYPSTPSDVLLSSIPSSRNLLEPWGPDGRWHIDGHGFQHYLFSSEIGLVAIMLFTDVDADGGGTAVAEGSHRRAARVLFEAGECDFTEHIVSILNTLYNKISSHSFIISSQ